MPQTSDPNAMGSMNLGARVAARLRARLRTVRWLETFPDFELEAQKIIAATRAYTMTSPERLYALIQAVRFIAHSRVEGDIVECGVWRGGSVMAAALTLVDVDNTERHIYGFDTFEGMSPPSAPDVDIYGRDAARFLKRGRRARELVVTEAAVRANVALVPYPQECVHFVKGMVEDTVPSRAPERIALLRLDTDWYESTRHEMIHLFPRLAPGGVLIVDDYGHWRGAKQAVDQYLSENNVSLLLNRIDYTGRIGVKR